MRDELTESVSFLEPESMNMPVVAVWAVLLDSVGPPSKATSAISLDNSLGAADLTCCDCKAIVERCNLSERRLDCSRKSAMLIDSGKNLA